MLVNYKIHQFHPYLSAVNVYYMYKLIHIVAILNVYYEYFGSLSKNCQIQFGMYDDLLLETISSLVSHGLDNHQTLLVLGSRY